jgi:acetoin utilization protein AcuB
MICRNIFGVKWVKIFENLSIISIYEVFLIYLWSIRMNVASIMTRKVVTVEMDDPIQTIWEVFNNFEFHHILVVEDWKLVGVISDRDLIKAVNPFLDTSSEEKHGAIALDKKAHQIMSKTPITIDAKTSTEEARNLLLENCISCLPVLSSQGIVEGIVTWKDIIKLLLKEKTLSII